MDLLERIVPTSLKHRLFVAFILLILLPFSLLILYHFNKMESVLRQTFSEQSMEQMQQINQTFAEMISEAYRTSVLLSQDSVIRQVLQQPDQYNSIERVKLIEEKFRAINNSFFLTTPQVYYTIADLQGRVYSSFMPSKPFEQSYTQDSILFQEALESMDPYILNVESNYVHPEFSRSPDLLSIHVSLLDDEFNPYAVVRISLDYYQWLQMLTEQFPEEHTYALIKEEGVLELRSTGDFNTTTFASLQSMDQLNGNYEENGYIINYNFMSSLGWYLVKKVPSDVVFYEVKKLMRSFFLTFFLLTVFFIIMTFAISSAVTKPLKRLERHMSRVAESNLKIHLPEARSKGEILQLTKSFNRMVSDIHDLIQQLKLEERRKEAVHFRMLHSQTNPHFLLNTLNTIKWIALNENNNEIVEICIALGKLLE
ncbi:MAG: HAMP domain-containing protein, partial [Bacilli bacterium]